MMVIKTLEGKNQLASWFFWLGVCIIPAASAFWVTVLSYALRTFPSIVAVPVLQVCAPAACVLKITQMSDMFMAQDASKPAAMHRPPHHC
jgi:hypothetical protein